MDGLSVLGTDPTSSKLVPQKILWALKRNFCVPLTRCRVGKACARRTAAGKRLTYSATHFVNLTMLCALSWTFSSLQVPFQRHSVS